MDGGGGAGWMGVGGLGGWGSWGVGGAPYTHAHTCKHTHACTCMRGKHDNSMQMAAPIGFGEIPGIPYDVIHACACVHACVCMRVHVHVCGGTLSPPPPPSTHPLTPGGTPGISQNSIALELIEIFQFCLKI